MKACGCVVNKKNNMITYCKVHNVAHELLDVLKSLGTKPVGYCFCHEVKNYRGHTGECQEARDAIAKAHGTYYA